MRRLILIVLGVIVVTQLALQIVVRTRYGDYHPSGIMWYGDGIVIDTVQLNDAVTLHKVFIEAMPWQVITGDATHILIAQMDVVLTPFAANHVYPWPHATPFTVENITVTLPYQQQKYVFGGDMKSFDPAHHHIALHSLSPQITGDIGIDVVLSDRFIKHIDVTIDDITAQRPELQMKRGGGWLAFENNNGWQVSGALDAGLVGYGSNMFTKANITLDQGVTYFSAQDYTTQKPISITVPSLRPSALLVRLLARSHRQ